MSVCLESIPKIVLVFGPKWVSYERSRGICRTKFVDILPRVEVRDSQTGYLLPARDGPGASPDVESSWDAAAVVAVSCQNVTLISFSFRAWIGLIWEISARNRRQNESFSGARLFCKHIKKSVFNDIYNIKVFQDAYSQHGFFPYAFQSPDPAAHRPALSI